MRAVLLRPATAGILRRWPSHSIVATRCLAEATPSGGAVSSSAARPVEEIRQTGDAPAAAEKKEEPKSGWGSFLGYFASGVGSVVFLYYFYKARYSFHQTEILMLEAFRRLPLYWPPGPKSAELNSRWEAEGLPEDIKLAFCEWFVVSDLEEPKGVTRDDVLELFNELGLREEAQPAKDFLFRGEGHIEEKKRLAVVGLQESLTLMSALRAHYGKQKEVAEAKGEEPPPAPKSDREAMEILRRKFRRADSVLSSARRLRDAATGPGGPGDALAGDSSAMMATAPTLPQAPPAEVRLEDCADLDEADDTQLEEARLRRLEEELLSRRDRLGSLSPAEEVRLADLRHQRAALKAA